MSDTRARIPRETHETERQPFETAYESARGYGYGQQATETGTGTGTGTEQPSVRERIESTFTGRTPEEQARYDRSREYQTRDTQTGAGTGTGAGSLAESMRSTMSTRPSLESGYSGGKYELSHEQPSVGEKIKAVFTGRTADQQQQYDQQREHEREWESQRQRQRERGRERGTGYGTETGTQPTFVERVEATFAGRTPQEQHEYDVRQRRQHELERSRGGSTSTSTEPGTSSRSSIRGIFGSHDTEYGDSFFQRLKQSMNEIRASIVGTRDETVYDRTTTERRERGRTGRAY